MVMCYAPDCKHYSERDGCKFFRFPKDLKERRKWIILLRRVDREPSVHSLVCSCHFVNGEKQNRPTMYLHNRKKQFVYLPPEKKRPSKITKKEVPISEGTLLNVQPSTSSFSMSDFCEPEPSTYAQSMSDITVAQPSTSSEMECSSEQGEEKDLLEGYKQELLAKDIQIENLNLQIRQLKDMKRQ